MAKRTGDKPPIHRAVPFPAVLAGLESLTLVTDHAYPRHCHDTYGMGLMTAGAQRSWSGRGPVESETGDIITVNPGEMHDGLPIGGAARSWRMIYFDPALAERELAGAPFGAREIARPSLRDPMLAQTFARLFARLAARVPDRLAVEEDLVLCLAQLFGRHGSRCGGAARFSPGVARALRRLDEAPERPASLAELADLAGVGRFQLLRGFAREVGATPHGYLTQRRVRLVRDRLKDGLTLAGAALAAGFADQSHMTRAFVRQFGLTPGRYRDALG